MNKQCSTCRFWDHDGIVMGTCERLGLSTGRAQLCGTETQDTFYQPKEEPRTECENPVYDVLKTNASGSYDAKVMEHDAGYVVHSETTFNLIRATRAIHERLKKLEAGDE